MSRIPNPFRSLVWPGVGPQVGWDRDWLELALIAVGVLLFGQGASIAVQLGLLAASIGMWWLGVVLGMGRVGRTWAGLIFMLAGGAAAAFGQGGLGLSYACMPWALAYGLAAVCTRRRLYAAIAAVAVALIFWGSDFGFTLTLLLILVLLVLVAAIDIKYQKRPSLAFVQSNALIALAIAVLGSGLAAIQLLPTVAGAAPGGEVAALSSGVGLGLSGVLAAFLTRPAVAPGAPVAYLGIAPFLCLIGLPWAVHRQGRRPLAALGFLGVFAVVLAAIGQSATPHLVTAHLGVATTALVALAGAGLDTIWAWAVANLALRRVRVPEAVAWAGARLGLMALSVLAFWSLSDLYFANRSLLTGSGPGISALTLIGELLRFDLAQHPVAFWVGAVMSGVSLLGVLALIVGDYRARRRRIEAEAVYDDGALRPAEPLDLPDGTPVHVTVEPAGEYSREAEVAAPELVSTTTAPPLTTAETTPAAAPAPAVAVAVQASGISERRGYLPWLLFALAIGVYLVTRFWSIELFPIYFFTDEAANPLFAQDLIARELRSATGERFPLYFEVAANRWGPLLSVYIHAISMTLFGKSVLVTRGTQALLSVLAAVAISLSLKYVFKARFWWAGALLLALVPAWFLHSRTGFETIIAASFYGCFILFYLLYRTRSPGYLYPALLFGAATFYTYSNGQMIMAASGMLLALFDIRYHLKNWRTALPGLLLVGVLMVPALRFRTTHPGLLETHLRVLDSYWFYDKPLSEKLALFVKTYTYGLSPSYWFLPSIPREPYEVRHLMQGYGNIATWMLPFFLIGVGVSLWRAVKGSAPYRVLLLATLATPAGAALAQIALTRVMAFVVPATVLTAIGIEAVLEVVRRKVSNWVMPPLLFVALTVPALLMTRDALVNGPLWYRDYELYGMQYGATQLFGDEIPTYLREHPDRIVIVSPTWANGTDNFVRFFLSQDQQVRVQMSNVDYFMVARRPLDLSMALVMTQNEFDRAQASGKFKSIEVDRTVPYPDGRTGFYFVRLAYADNLDEILAKEREERSRPVAEQIELDGQIVDVLHSQFDIGLLPNAFDGDAFTLVRGLEANPLVFEFTFPQPRQISRLQATFASMDFTLTARLYTADVAEPIVYEQTFRGQPPDPTVALLFDQGPTSVSRIRLEVLQLNAGTEVHIHVREIKFE